MSNPTTGNESQFNNPFNILPDLNPGVNPTIENNTQFFKPFNILPDRIYRSPLSNGIASGQFTTPLQFGGQYNTFDILPNVSYINPTRNVTTDQFSRRNNEQNIAASNFAPQSAVNTNRSSENVGTVALGILSGRLGVPFASQITSTIGANSMSTPYSTLPLDKLKLIPGIKYSDFRSRISNAIKVVENPTNLLTARADGTFSILRNTSTGKKPWKSIAYAAAAISPAGAYALFNLNASGKFGYGYGDHDNPNALRNDFTIGSETTTIWVNRLKKDKPGIWIPSPTDTINPFRGDKVNVIDFSQRTKKEAYKWKPTLIPTDSVLGRIIASDSLTQDFIKFYFTGPKLQNGLDDAEDDIMVFRAAITSLGDSFNANWNPVNMIGRADPNYHYTGYSRDLSLNFDVYATSRDELKPIWRKLNALAGYTAPEYNKEDIALRAPWMRITIGDLFHQQPVVLNSLNFDYGTDASWEINIEDDQTNMQVPFKISVTCQMNLIMDYLPQKGGRFYTLAKRYGSDAAPKQGSDNWLSDVKDNITKRTGVGTTTGLTENTNIIP